MVSELKLGGEFQLGPSLLGFIFYLPSFVNIMFNFDWNCVGAMDLDLDAVLFSDEGVGAQKSKRPRGSQRSDRPSKVPSRTEKTPTAQTATSTAEEPNAQVDATVSTTSATLPPAATQLTIG